MRISFYNHFLFFFFNDTATTEIYTLSLHDALPICQYGDGLNLFGYISRRFPNLGLVVLTMLDNSAILQALGKVSNISIVSKADPVLHLVPAIHPAYTGGTYFSPAISERVEKMNAGVMGG